ncbi:MAG TPA: hypothetical protein VEY07_07620 [Thermoplasmata archaeon]|nr:hypothetical protein [Thermoplasmata archaeon]
MVERRRPVDITLERSIPDPAGGPPVVVRVAWHLDDGSDATSPVFAKEMESLRGQLDSAVAALVPKGTTLARAERSLDELIEAYRPRQPELLDLLRAEGELTTSEYELLRAYLARSESPRPAPAGVPITDRPIAAAPLESDRAPSTARPTEELLRVYQIASLKQAGAVRARRQISFEEYMALKRHFAAAPAA